MSLYEYDRSFGAEALCGVDEAGRGPFAGPVYAAAVILPLDDEIEGINDSKKISEKKREALFDIIKEKALAFSIASATVEEIDEVNILQATFLAMKRAVEGLNIKPDFVLIDGNKNTYVGAKSKCVIKGDATSANVAAASILAKVARDRYMLEVAKEYPEYQFHKHKGYGTKLHRQLIKEYGMAPIHRRSFLVKLNKEYPGISLYKGQYGEKLAYAYLKKYNYVVLVKNYHSTYGEIDLIAVKNNCICFIEVKLRDESCLFSPAEAVIASKQTKIIKTAVKFLEAHSCDYQPRFDVIEILLLKDEKININMIENAFSPEGDYGLL